MKVCTVQIKAEVLCLELRQRRKVDEAEEYVKYIKHLQSKNVLMSEIEYLQLEDLQGTTGLKALRVSVNFNQSEEKATLDSFKKVLNK